MQLKAFEKIKSPVRKEFYALTGILPLHFTNRLQDKCINKDAIFNALAEKTFDMPRLLDLLFLKIKHWLKSEDGEFVFFLAGCIYYCRQEYCIAEKYFRKALRKNPYNLDNLFALAFSMYHQGQKKHAAAKKMIFDFQHQIKKCKK